MYPESAMMEPEDFYIEDDKVVFTAKYLLKRGYCCGNICRHCPYGEDIQRAASGRGVETNDVKGDRMRNVRIEHHGTKDHHETLVIDLATGSPIECASVTFCFFSHYNTGAHEVTELQFNKDGDALGPPVETMMVKEFVWKDDPKEIQEK
jgi:hypothetical protein